jgi:hypothetical protein
MKRAFFLSALFLNIFLFGCNTPPTEEENVCVSKQEITPDQIVGVWEGGIPSMRDRLEIHNDGTYKQYIFLEARNYSYESDWHEWAIEKTETGTQYLKLYEMNLCIYLGKDNCSASEEATVYDLCKDQEITLDNAGIFILKSPMENTTISGSSVSILPLLRSTEGGGTSYNFVGKSR